MPLLDLIDENIAALIPKHVLVDDIVASMSYQVTLPYGELYDYESPVLTGYDVDVERVTGTLTEDTEITVTYTAQLFTLTIVYRYQDGTWARPDYTAQVAFGTEYDVASRVTGTMPAEDVRIVVIYVTNAQTIVIDEPETPLGLGMVGINVGESIE